TSRARRPRHARAAVPPRPRRRVSRAQPALRDVAVGHADDASSAAAAVKVLPSRAMIPAAAPPGSTLPTSRADCVALDRADPLASLRDAFVVPDGVVYLDGNSLGALPRRTPARLAEVATREWGEGLIRSWNTAGWIDLAQRIGDKIAALIGAGPGEVSVADS